MEVDDHTGEKERGLAKGGKDNFGRRRRAIENNLGMHQKII